ncbi:MAG: hypothetical protein F7C32_00765 [Desulfurococcales archaeon]|nr:hypothetical protein [Desulfurococcales archaeon]
MRIEAEYVVAHGKTLYDSWVYLEGDDAFYRTVVYPGFSDTHMHPQVISSGIERPGIYRDSYDWIERRNLGLDEAAIRRDTDLSAKLARLAMFRSLLEGTTLIALTGSLKGNIRGWYTARVQPRTVFLPTAMNLPGWQKHRDIIDSYRRLRLSAKDGFARMGIFVHSLKFSTYDMILESYIHSYTNRTYMGIHLGEGVSEADKIKKILGRHRLNRIVAVHCIDDKVKPLGMMCSSCPGTNYLLYNRFKLDTEDIDAFGSDWPHILGTTASQIGFIFKLYNKPRENILFKMTTGGYLAYSMAYSGDLVAYDEPLPKVLSGKAKPVAVYVGGRKVVEDGKIIGLNLSIADILRETEEAVKETYDLYGDGTVDSSDVIRANNILKKAIEELSGF